MTKPPRPVGWPSLICPYSPGERRFVIIGRLRPSGAARARELGLSPQQLIIVNHSPGPSDNFQLRASSEVVRACVSGGIGRFARGALHFPPPCYWAKREVVAPPNLCCECSAIPYTAFPALFRTDNSEAGLTLASPSFFGRRDVLHAGVKRDPTNCSTPARMRDPIRLFPATAPRSDA